MKDAIKLNSVWHLIYLLNTSGSLGSSFFSLLKGHLSSRNTHTYIYVCVYKNIAVYFFKKRQEIGSKMLHSNFFKSPEQSINLSQFETVKLRNS